MAREKLPKKKRRTLTGPRSDKEVSTVWTVEQLLLSLRSHDAFASISDVPNLQSSCWILKPTQFDAGISKSKGTPKSEKHSFLLDLYPIGAAKSQLVVVRCTFLRTCGREVSL